MERKNSQKYVWYACYGSNLYKKRFMDYIRKCRDPSSPKGDKQIRVRYPLYFAKKSSKWGGGVAFIGLRKKERNATLGRMYLIKEQQFEDVFCKENAGNSANIDFQKVKKGKSLVVLRSWYGNVVYLGEQEGFPIFTFTAYWHMGSEQPVAPSEKYLKKIILGLKETYKLSNRKILDYLITKPGIAGNIKKTKLTKLIQKTGTRRHVSKNRLKK